jgi:competence protein ComEA
MHNVNRNRANSQEQHRRRNRSGVEMAAWPGSEGDGLASIQSIDLNHATFEQLTEIDGITERDARAIIERRKLHGHFLSWDDVRQVPGLEADCLTELQHAARIGAPRT